MDEHLTGQVKARFTPDEMLMIRTFARDHGTTPAALARMLILDYVKYAGVSRETRLLLGVVAEFRQTYLDTTAVALQGELDRERFQIIADKNIARRADLAEGLVDG